MEEIKRKLIEKHGDAFTPMQYRGWAELLAIDAHSSYDVPPPYPMFNGGRTTQKKANPSSDLTTAFTSMAQAVAMAFKPSPSTPQQTVLPERVHTSQEKIADVRSKYIQQIKELHSLLQIGALSEEEFLDQKHPVLEQLKKLQP